MHDKTFSRDDALGTSRSALRMETRRRYGGVLPQNISEAERWGSLAAGAGLMLWGLARGRGSGLLLTLLGGGFLYRGWTGHCHGYELLGVDTSEHAPLTAVPARAGVKLTHTILVYRPVHEVYRFWRNLENMPRVMPHVKEVHVLDERRSQWGADGWKGESLHWEAEIINESENELIAWRSLPGGDIETAGSVRFQPTEDQRGTSITVSLKYNPPGGRVAARLAWLFGESVEQKIAQDLQTFKQRFESGELTSH